MEWNEICLVFDSTFELKTDVEKKIHAVFQSMVSVHLVIRQMLHHQQKHKHKILIQSGEQLEIHKKTKTARGECEIWIRLLREHFCGVYGVLHKEAMVR